MLLLVIAILTNWSEFRAISFKLEHECYVSLMDCYFTCTKLKCPSTTKFNAKAYQIARYFTIVFLLSQNEKFVIDECLISK